MISGNLEQLNIPSLELQGLSGSSVNAKAILYNVTDSLKLAYDITVFNTHILKNDLAEVSFQTIIMLENFLLI